MQRMIPYDKIANQFQKLTKVIIMKDLISKEKRSMSLKDIIHSKKLGQKIELYLWEENNLILDRIFSNFYNVGIISSFLFFSQIEHIYSLPIYLLIISYFYFYLKKINKTNELGHENKKLIKNTNDMFILFLLLIPIFQTYLSHFIKINTGIETNITEILSNYNYPNMNVIEFRHFTAFTLLYVISFIIEATIILGMFGFIITKKLGLCDLDFDENYYSFVSNKINDMNGDLKKELAFFIMIAIDELENGKSNLAYLNLSYLNKDELAELKNECEKLFLLNKNGFKYCLDNKSPFFKYFSQIKNLTKRQKDKEKESYRNKLKEYQNQYQNLLENYAEFITENQQVNEIVDDLKNQINTLSFSSETDYVIINSKMTLLADKIEKTENQIEMKIQQIRQEIEQQKKQTT